MKASAKFAVVLLGCTSLTAIHATASAQAENETVKEVESGSEETRSLDRVTVTGSRIQNGASAPTPVTMVDTATLKVGTPAGIAEALEKLPIFTRSNNQSTNGGSGANTVGNFLNLRGLGTNRALVLFDGHRMPDSALSGGVDTNLIPQFMLERVEVVTGGASAVYGSDAVAGVINFIVDDEFTGLKFEGETGISGRNDNPTQRFGIGYGTDLAAGRGHFLASYNYYYSGGIRSKTERENGALTPHLVGAGTAASPFVPVQDARFTFASFDGRVLSGPAAGQQFVLGGNLGPFANGALTASPAFQSGGDGFFYDTGFIAGLQAHQGYTRFDYDLTNNVSAYIQGTYSKSENSNPFVNHQFTSLQLFTDNAFLSPAASAALSANGDAAFVIGRVDSAYSMAEFETENYFLNFGLMGELGAGYEWEISYTNSQTDQTGTNPQNINNGKQSAALDAVGDGSGNIVCRVTLTNPGLYPGCVPINLFGAGSISPEALDYITDPTVQDLTQELDNFSASLTGPLFELPAGTVQFAVSGEYREASVDVTSNAQPQTFVDCTGLLLNCTPGATAEYRYGVVPNTTGSQKVSEAAIELDVPLLADMPFIQALSVNGAARYTDYDTSGAVDTWKLGADWQVSDALRFRTTRSQDIRAPNLNELFAPSNQFRSGFNDLHTNTSGITEIRSGGNGDLEPEEADTFTFGVVYNPAWLPGLTATVDYYDIEIENAIIDVTGATAMTVCEASDGTDPLCDLIIRPLPFSDRSPANFPTLVLSQPQNVAAFSQSGIDMDVSYRTGLWGGDLTLRGLATYVESQESQQLSTTPVVQAAGTVDTPRWKLVGIAGYNHGPWSINTQTRWRGSVEYSRDPRLVYNVPDVDAVAFTDATISHDLEVFGGAGSVYISVQNVFDQEAPLFYPNVGAPGFAYPAVPGDDVIGRRFNIGFRATF